MEAEQEIAQKHRMNPRSLENLKPPFSPGQSGNPGGLPKGTPKVSVALRKLLAIKPEEGYEPRNYAEAIALEILKKAHAGNVAAAEFVADRTEGKAPQSIKLGPAEPPNDELEAALAASGISVEALESFLLSAATDVRLLETET